MRGWACIFLLLAGCGATEADRAASTGTAASAIDGSGQGQPATPDTRANTTVLPDLPVPRSSNPNRAVDVLPPPDQTLELTDEEQRIALAASQTPHIYVALQTNGSRPVSIVFAIDESRDGTPQNDAAIRLTPEDGSCNPQVMRNFNFPPEQRGSPTFSGDELLRGIDPAKLPAFLAVKVTEEMLSRGLAETREDTRAHNICTRKMWEAQIANPVTEG